LDAEFRESMRAEIKRLHIDQHATSVYVTHDQIEAMAMGDRIVVMSNAEVQQAATPMEVYNSPANLFVARFIGSPGMNLIEGNYADGVIRLPGDNRYNVPSEWRDTLASSLPADGRVIVGFRPEAADVHEEGAVHCTTFANDLHGGYTMLHLQLDRDHIIHVRAGREMRYQLNDTVHFDIRPDMVRFFHPETEKTLHKGKA
jgi:multiple sugar transport system ATP-binding protein